MHPTKWIILCVRRLMCMAEKNTTNSICLAKSLSLVADDLSRLSDRKSAIGQTENEVNNDTSDCSEPEVELVVDGSRDIFQPTATMSSTPKQDVHAEDSCCPTHCVWSEEDHNPQVNRFQYYFFI